MPEHTTPSRLAIVSGAGGGIGTVIVDRLQADGFRVAGLDLSFPDEFGADQFEVDLSDRAAIQRAIEALHERLGPVSVLVHAAAYETLATIDTLTDEAWEQTFRVNVGGAFRLIQELLPDLQSADSARIVFLTSSSLYTPPPTMSHYIASKGALMGLAHGLAVDLGSQGITVNSVAPGLTRTPRALADLPEEQFAKTAERQAIRRNGEPADVASAVAFLVSEEASFITGQTLLVDGGENPR